MAFNREKAIDAAQKHLRAGKVDKAIKEYERIIEDDPDDVRSKLKIADLYVKAERFDLALRAYNEVAYTYAKQDLYEKAAAVYKQAMRIAPEDPQLYAQLGEAYFRLGRLKDAVRVLHKAQKIYKRDGDERAGREILERMVHIDPEDVGLQIQLAERYEKDGMRTQAQDLFRTSADQLREEGRVDEYVQVVERMIFLAPQSVEMRKEVVRIYLSRGDEKHALKHLQICFKLNPQDIETLELLGSTFHRLGANDKAALVYVELGALYERLGNVERAGSAYRTLLSIDPSHPEARRFLGASAAPAPRPEPARPAPAPAPEPEPEDDDFGGIEFLDDDGGGEDEFMDVEPDASEAEDADGLFLAYDGDEQGYEEVQEYQAVVEISEASLEVVAIEPAGDERITQYLTESEVFLKYGLLDRAEDVITKVLQLQPDHVLGREQMSKLLVRLGDRRGAAHQLVEVARIKQSDRAASDAYLAQAAEIVDAETLTTLARSAGLDFVPEQGDFAPSFLNEVSEGLEEVSSTVNPEQAEEAGIHTLDIPRADDSDEVLELSEDSAIEDYAPAAQSEEVYVLPDPDEDEQADDGAGYYQLDEIESEPDEVAPAFEVEPSSPQLEEDSEELEPPDERTDDFDDLEPVAELADIPTDATIDEINVAELTKQDFDVQVEFGGVEVGEFSEFNEDNLSLSEADVVELDVDAANFDQSTHDALAALDMAAGSGELNLDFSAEDADMMFEELFGGVFGDDSDGVDALDLPAPDALDAHGDAPFRPVAAGSQSLSLQFGGVLTNPSIELPSPSMEMEAEVGNVNNSSLELGKTYKDMGLFSEAIEEFRHAMEDPEAAPAAIYHIALCHLELGEKADAQHRLTELTQDESIPAQWRSIASEKLSELGA